MLELWNATRDELKRQLDAQFFESHFADFVVTGIEEETLTIATPDEMTAILVDKNYRDLIERCVTRATGRRLQVRVSSARADAPVPPASMQLSLFDAPAPTPASVNGVNGTAHSAEAAPTPGPARVAPSRPDPRPEKPEVDIEAAIRHAGLNRKFHLSTFVVGGANEFAYEAARAVIEQPGRLYNPLFLYGGVGLGKTHLMNAIGLGILEADPTRRVRFISAETFVNELIESIGARRMDEFRQKNRTDVDCLLIDDIQFIAGKERTQEEFFHTFNALYQAGRQIVITSDRIPQEMPELEERLMSRLNMGLIADLQPPDLETRIAILRKHAVDLDFDAPTDALEYIAAQVRSNVRELHGALLRIGTYARLQREPISLSLAQSQLERVHRDRTGNVSPELILKITAETFGVSVRDIKGPKRVRTIATPRKVAMYLARTHTDASFPELGAVFGRDHTTIISAVKSVEKLVAKGDPMRHRIEAIERRLG
jgi:chromosomal replication initiator protein